jgi:putative oxidoreductase
MQWLFGNYVKGRGAAGLLILRLVFGIAIMMHGWGKIRSEHGPTAWMGEHSSVPGFFQAMSAAAEFSGGLGIIFGFLTPVAAFGLFCNMFYAVFIYHIWGAGDPFVAMKPGVHSYEAAAGYLAVSLLMFLTGPGAWSVDAILVGLIYGKDPAKRE